MKKYLIISIIALVIITAGALLYYFIGIEKPIEENISTSLTEVQKIETNTGVSKVVSREIGTNKIYNSFFVEGENVYWIDRNFPDTKNIIIGADAKTFELLNECKYEGCYAKDKSKVFLLSEIMGVVGLEIIGEANPNTFRILSHRYSRDENNFFCNWNKISGIDIVAFRAIGYGFTDNKSVYWGCNKLEGIDDPKSLVFTENMNDGILQDQNFIYHIIPIGPEETKVEKLPKNISFSPSEISEILKKIDENTKKQEEIRKNATELLLQGNFKAKYVSNHFDTSKSDSIIVTKNGVEKIIPGIHPNPTNPRLDPEFEFISGLEEFSPTGNYILYHGVCDMSCPSGLLDTQNGKQILTFNNLGFHAWTEDRKQFIFAQLSNEGCPSGSLSITINNAFPKIKTILEINFISAFTEKNMLYVRSYDRKKICDINEKELLRIYDLNTLTEVYSQEIK